MRSPLLPITLVPAISLVLSCGGSGMPSQGSADAAVGQADARSGADAGSGSADAAAAGDAATAPTDFSTPGAFGVATTTGSISTPDCTLDYALYTPAGGDAAPLVVLGHGFSRDASNVAGIAEHVASFGVRVVAPSYCGGFSPDHVKNGQDAVALASALAAGADVIYAGHSAGGLSAIIAAEDDSDAIAAVGLDLTDASELALGASVGVNVPSLGLVGDPGSCNSQGNGRAVFGAMAMATTIHVVGASHCDFEEPTGLSCTTFCGFDSAERLTIVKALTAAFIAWRAGMDPTGEAWISPTGSEFLRLQADGAIALVP